MFFLFQLAFWLWMSVLFVKLLWTNRKIYINIKRPKFVRVGFCLQVVVVNRHWWFWPPDNIKFSILPVGIYSNHHKHYHHHQNQYHHCHSPFYHHLGFSYFLGTSLWTFLLLNQGKDSPNLTFRLCFEKKSLLELSVRAHRQWNWFRKFQTDL